MPVQSAASLVAVLPDAEIRRQLDRILKSKTFQQVERLKRFIAFIATETAEGRGDHLKEFVIGVQVFDKEASFDPRNDPIVRVQARRLRARLARYYREEGRSDEVLIDMPKGGYSTVFKRVQAPTPKPLITSALINPNTVVVLPFIDDSPGGDLDYFCKGVTHEVIHTLVDLETTRVLASESPIPQELSAATIICGNVRRSGDEIRITTQLIDGATGCYVWSNSMDRKESEVFAIQEEVAQTILKRLQSEGSERGTRKRGRRPTENLAAHNLYLQGRYHLSQRTEEGLRKAVEFFERAIVEDAQYAQAYSGLSDAYGLLGHYGVLAPVEVWTKTASNAAWAVLQDENSAEAHTSLAHVKSTQDWDWLGSEREFQRALQLDSSYSTAHHWYAISCLAPMGRLDEALEEMLRAQALDPISSIVARDLAVIRYYKRDFEGALEQCDHTVELNPHFSPAYLTLGLIQEQIGDFEESAAAFQRAIQLSPKSPRMKAALGRTLTMSGNRREALKVLDELKTLAEIRYVSPFDLASLYFALEETDKGFDWLKKSFQDRCFELVSIKVDPRFDTIKSDPRFNSLADQLGLH